MPATCPQCGFAFKGRPGDYLREPPAAARLKKLSIVVLFPVLAAVFVYLKFGAAWFGLPTAFTGMANTLMLVMVSPSVALYVIALRLPPVARYECRACGWAGARPAGEPGAAREAGPAGGAPRA
jgi:rubredoxin